MQNSDEQRQRLMDEINNYKNRVESLNEELDKNRKLNDHLAKNISALEQNIRSLKQQRDEFGSDIFPMIFI